MPPPADILILKPSSLGDVVHTLPSASLLRAAFPAAKIRWLVNTEWMPILDGNPHIDEAVEFPRRDFRGVRGALRIAPWARKLRERFQPDLILDYQGLLRSGLIAKMCRGEGARVVGLADAREGSRFFHDESASVAGCVHAVDRYLALTRHVTGATGGADARPPSPLPPGVPVPGVELPARYVLLHPFSRGAGKSLAPEDVRKFCERLAPTPVVLAGRSEERVAPAENVIDLLNATDLHGLVWLLRNADAVVSVDSGPMHMAAALDVPLVSIHTWSDPAKVGPYRPDAWVWKDGRLQTRAGDSRQDIYDLPALADFILHHLLP